MGKKIVLPDLAAEWRKAQRLERKVAELKKQIDGLKWRNRQLRFQIYQLGGIPIGEKENIAEYGEV